MSDTADFDTLGPRPELDLAALRKTDEYSQTLIDGITSTPAGTILFLLDRIEELEREVDLERSRIAEVQRQYARHDQRWHG